MRTLLVLLSVLLVASCAARVEPRLDAGLNAGWSDGPKVGGNLGLGKYEGGLAPLPLMGPVPSLSPDATVSSSPSSVQGAAGPDLCAGGSCAIAPPTDPAPATSETVDPAPVPTPRDGGVPWPVQVVAFLALAVGVLLGTFFLVRKVAAPAPAPVAVKS
jgi:hypothetical protein